MSTFWATQPVQQIENKPFVAPKLSQLPNTYRWCQCDINDIDDVYNFLKNHYGEDDNHQFRLHYSKEFLQWYFSYSDSVLLGVKSIIGARPLVAFISSIVSTISVFGTNTQMAKINFLCIHKKLRQQGLAPLLISKITALMHEKDIHQAIYTTNRMIHQPLSTCHYYHRPINLNKLLDVNFMSLRGGGFAKLQKKWKVNPTTLVGFRQMTENDLPEVLKLVNTHLQTLDVYEVFDTITFHYWFANSQIKCYVVSNNNEMTDFISYYTVQFAVLNKNKHDYVNVGYLYYMAARESEKLVNRLLFEIKDTVDVFMTLHIGGIDFLEQCKFNKGSQLYYYLYNFTHFGTAPEKISVAMM